MISEEEHKAIHVELHKYLDELIADFLRQTGKPLSEITLLDLVEWSYEQTKNPTVQKN